MPKRVMIIGWVEGNTDDRFTLGVIASELSYLGFRDISKMLYDALDGLTSDVYDMHTRPEKGDALDHLDSDVGLVVALHLYGIDKLPYQGEIRPAEIEAYCRDNFYLLERCMKLGIPLIAYGDQPWFGVQKALDFTQPWFPMRVVLYQPEENK